MTEGCFDRPFEEASEASPTTLALATTRSIELAAVPTRREHDLLGKPRSRPMSIGAFIRCELSKIFPSQACLSGIFLNLCAPRRSSNRRPRAPTGVLAIWLPARRRRSTGPAASSSGQTFSRPVRRRRRARGAGTSTNMNANEVIANVALELIGRPAATMARSTRSTTSTWPSPPMTPIPARCGLR